MRSKRLVCCSVALGLLFGTAGCDFLFDDPEREPPDIFPPPDSRDLPPLVTAPEPLPPISGGTLLTAGDTVLASDPDRDRIVVADLGTQSVVATIALEDGSEPGRIVEGAVDSGTFYAVLRGSGELATIHSADWSVETLRMCASLRGIAYDPAADRLHLACATGELMTVDPADGTVERALRLDDDLRDVVVAPEGGGRIYVSRFRTAEVLMVEADGAVAARLRPNTVEAFVDFRGGGAMSQFLPAVAWRMLPDPDGNGVALVHQLGRVEASGEGVPTRVEGGYGGGGGCNDGAIVQAGVSFLSAPGTQTSRVSGFVLPVDIAATDSEVAIVAAGALPFSRDFGGGAPVMRGPRDILREVSDFGGACGFATPLGGEGQVIALAFSDRGQLIVQSREPSELWIDGFTRISLGGESRRDTGHELFHQDAGVGMACASCHAEGHDDSLTWTFADIGQRRTQSIAGGILGTEPFHWDGDMRDFEMLVHEVFEGRMGGPDLPADYLAALGGYIDSIPEPLRPPVRDAGAVERGSALFHSTETNCTSCHSGASLTNNNTVNVGTGGSFQVPSLVGIAARAPYMHDGCAPTLRDRLTNPDCGGGDDHGHTSQLTTEQVDDLVAYLQTL